MKNAYDISNKLDDLYKEIDKLPQGSVEHTRIVRALNAYDEAVTDVLDKEGNSMEISEEWWSDVHRLINSDAIYWLALYISPEKLRKAYMLSNVSVVLKLLNRVCFRLPDTPEVRHLPNYHLVHDLCELEEE